ncbi:MarR family winged helix-turn-helix transcriptional regulator [Microbacterium sp. P05]|uniref:MarR family winged helix-turn-helix transcriptional regulator n=1 Tax=Microbacterium sp. P05 TaxID=3366948 RepID=UPI003746D83E
MDASDSAPHGPEEGVERSRMSAHELSWSLRATNRAATEVDRALAAHLSLRPLEYDAIDHIMSSESDPIGPVELSSRLGISPGSATEMVDRLERDGHVVRERGAADRRRVLVTARPEAVERILGNLTPLFDGLDDLATTFTPREQASIQRYLREASALLTDYAASLDRTD